MSRSRAIAKALWPYAPPLAVVIAEWGLLSPVPALADHFQFWAAGHMIATGQSPYARAAWEAAAAYGPLPDGVAVNTVIGNLRLTDAVWVYPPQMAILFAPLGALPLAVGVPLLHLAVLLSAVAGVVLAARAAGLAGAPLAFALTATAVSQPFVITVRDGHPIGLVLVGSALAYLGIRDRRVWPVAAGALLISIKPHIAIAFGVAVLLVLLRRRDARTLAITALALLAVTGAAELRDPFPFAQLSGATTERLALDLSSTGALARDLGGGIGLTAALALASLIAAAMAVRRAPADHRGAMAFGASLLLSLVIAPYVHDYDQLLVLPAAFVALAIAGRSRHRPLIRLMAGGLIAVVPWVLFFWWSLLDQDDRVFKAGALGALPVLMAFGVALASWLAARTTRRAAADAPISSGA